MNTISEQQKGLRTWVEINQANLKKNYLSFRKLVRNDCKIMAVVKSNAYGHGLVDSSRVFEKVGADWLGVDSITEALALRNNGIIKPILVLGYTLPERIEEAILQNISITISSIELLNFIVEKKLNINAHIKIDSGMHRQGFFSSQIPEVIKILKQNPSIKIEGVYTHFAAAKNPSFPQETNQQFAEFDQAVQLLIAAGFNPVRHAAATSGAIVFPQYQLDMVRIGIGLYGLWPSTEVKYGFSDKFPLKASLSWKTVVSEIKTLPAGSAIGYDFSETVTKTTKVGICPIGYWHGFPRSLSSVGRVLVNGKRAKILGKVCMDIIMIDISNIETEVGTEVVLIGKNRGEEITAEEFALMSGRYNYETVTTINPLIKRILLP